MTAPAGYELLAPSLIDTEKSAFLANQPQVTPVTTAPERNLHRRHLEEAAVALGVAFIIYRHQMQKELEKRRVEPDEDVHNAVAEAWKKIAPLWLRLAIPALKEAYLLGDTANLTDAELTSLATDYAVNLGNYINTTSGDALVVGFEAQIAQRWNEKVAWRRATAAYGLDKQQMKSYVTGVMKSDTEQNDLVPLAAKTFVDRALSDRAEKLGKTEAFHASKMGKTLGWLIGVKNGTLPPESKKIWLTAEDERVCPICGPLDKQTVPVGEQWTTIEGEKVWAPGIHPRCRCDVQLIVPDPMPWTVVEKQLIQKDLPGDPYDRDQEGRFAPKEERQPRRGRLRPTAQTAERMVDPMVQDILEQVATIAEKPVADYSNTDPFASTQGVDPFASQASSVDPFVTQSVGVDPFAAASIDPFARTKTADVDPFAQPAVAKPRRKRITRNILILRPGQKGEEEEMHTINPEDMDVRADGEWFAYYNDYRRADPHDEGYAWNSRRDRAGVAGDFDDDTGKDTLKVGDILDFDFTPNGPGQAQPMVTALRYHGQHKHIAEAVADNYDDYSDWHQSEALAQAAEEYNSAYEVFHEEAIENMEDIVSQLSEQDLRAIYRQAGIWRFAASRPIDDLRTRITDNKDAVNPLVDATLDYVARNRPTLVGGAYGAGDQLETARKNFEDLDAPQPHTPRILIFHNPTADILEPHQQIAVTGAYRVDRIVHHTADFEALNSNDVRPRNMAGWDEVHLAQQDTYERPEDFYPPDFE